MKRTTKRKMYQKRRKKEKAERKRLQPKVEETTYTKHNRHNHTRSQVEWNPTKQNASVHFPSSSLTCYSQGLQAWWQTYCSAMEFYTKQHNAYVAQRQKNERLLEKYANEYETSSEEENDKIYENNNDANNDTDEFKDPVDEEYIKFLEITYKHREELRLKRSTDI